MLSCLCYKIYLYIPLSGFKVLRLSCFGKNSSVIIYLNADDKLVINVLDEINFRLQKGPGKVRKIRILYIDSVCRDTEKGVGKRCGT